MIIAGIDQPAAFRQAVEMFRSVSGGDRFLHATGTISFVAIESGDVAGWCWGQHIIRPDEDSMVYLHELEVADSFLSMGIGRELVLRFVDTGRALGASKMFLTTGEGNAPARALYEQLGAGLATQGPTVNYWFSLASGSPHALGG